MSILRAKSESLYLSLQKYLFICLTKKKKMAKDELIHIIQ